ncbi:MAG: PDZ domain-containing protein [Elusimicrobia bacterium]|jgi:hypothetical protein|nr:PDZ domain-containing protein [Elusimicrobiota bacterium]
MKTLTALLAANLLLGPAAAQTAQKTSGKVRIRQRPALSGIRPAQAKPAPVKVPAPLAPKPQPAPAPAVSEVPPTVSEVPSVPAGRKSLPPAQAPAGRRPVPPVPLNALGAVLRDGEGSAETLAVLPGSEAEAMGLAAGDRLAILDGTPIRSRGEAAQAWLAWDPALRLWAAARRGLQVVDLQSRPPAEEPAFARGRRDLSAREAAVKERLLQRAALSARMALAQAPSLQVSVPARQALWIRFPDGLSGNVATGDILTGEVTMAVASDASLDFLCVPPRSTVWGKVLHASQSDGVRSVRIHFFKAALAGGHTIPISARPTDAAGEQPLVKVSPGGSLVIGEPPAAEPARKRRGAPLLDPDMRLRLELDLPVVVTEPPRFYPAGAGLWIKTKETESGRAFEVSIVVPGRSAEKAGLRVGDLLTSIAGRAAAKMDFAEALAALYGAPGSVFKASALKPGAEKPVTFELKRGVFYKDGVETPVPLPFEKRA